MKKSVVRSLLWAVVLVMLMGFSVGCQEEVEGMESPAVHNENTEKEEENSSEPMKEEESVDNSFTVILDPGHGGEETGRQAFGYDEKDLNNQLTERIAKELEARGVTLKYTRHYSEDYNLSLSERMEMANDMEADLFLSIHHDGSVYTEARGVTVFYSTYRPLISLESAYLRSEDQAVFFELIGEAGNSEGRKDYIYLNAEGEEAFANPTLDSWEPFEKYPSKEALLSRSLAENLAEALAETGLWMRGPIDAPYYVTRRSVHTSVLVEAGFMTNSEELEGIIDPVIQQQRAETIADTVYKFLVENSEKGM